MKKLFAAAIGVLALTAVSASAQEMALKYSISDPDRPTELPSAAQAHVFKATLESLSGGAMTVDIFANGQLGDQRAIVPQVRRGSVDFANIAVGVLASLYYPELGVVDLPFLYTTRAQMRRALSLDRPFIRDMVEDIAEKTGIRILSFDPFGFRHMTTSDRPIHSPADMQGLKMRTMEVVPHQEMMNALGASPTPIPFLELYTSLQTGVVDGEENTPINILQQKFYQVQKHMTLTNHLMTVGAIIINEDWYQSLTDEQRQMVLAASHESELANAGVGAVQDLMAIKELEAQGMEIYTPTPEEMNAFREATREPVRQWAVEQWGAEFVDGFFANLEEAGM